MKFRAINCIKVYGLLNLHNSELFHSKWRCRFHDIYLCTFETEFAKLQFFPHLMHSTFGLFKIRMYPQRQRKSLGSELDNAKQKFAGIEVKNQINHL